MDNFRIDITHEGTTSLTRALETAIGHAPGGKATHYRKTSNRFVFFWSAEKNTHSLPMPMRADAAAKLITQWLDEEADYGGEPDHDGDNGRGWRLFNESWGHVEGSPYGICAVEPAWAMYGK